MLTIFAAVSATVKLLQRTPYGHWFCSAAFLQATVTKGMLPKPEASAQTLACRPGDARGGAFL